MSKPARGAMATVDQAEIGKFANLADRWWDPEGEMKPLHALNPIRIAYIRDQLLAHYGGDADGLRPLRDMHLLDIGCGGGLLSEPLARLGAQVTGIDAAPEAVKTAKAHAELQGVNINYRVATASELANTGETFDAVLAMEIVEHVRDVGDFLHACGELVKPGGLIFVSTLNRTPKSLLLAKVGAEYILRWLPRGTHDWRRFLKPSEVAQGLRPAGLETADVIGVSFDLLSNSWKPSRNTDVNYMLLARKPT